ncbi:hypothetical protein OFC37_30930, partial [Escherichia coli]|nr:hypothetical protein [Escherichia coli]
VNNAPNFIDKFGLVWLRKGNDYFWVDDKDFEKHGEIWKKNGHYDEVIQNGTIIELGDRQDNDRARSFAGKRVMLGNGNRVEEVDESGAM